MLKTPTSPPSERRLVADYDVLGPLPTAAEALASATGREAELLRPFADVEAGAEWRELASLCGREPFLDREGDEWGVITGGRIAGVGPSAQAAVRAALEQLRREARSEERSTGAPVAMRARGEPGPLPKAPAADARAARCAGERHMDGRARAAEGTRDAPPRVPPKVRRRVRALRDTLERLLVIERGGELPRTVLTVLAELEAAIAEAWARPAARDALGRSREQNRGAA